MADMPEPAAIDQKLWSDLLPLFDQELSRLPDKYRIPIILCDLEGKTHKEAARKFGCKEGSLSSRLSRGRNMLAKRLGRQGLAVSGVMLGVVMAQNAASASVPMGLVTGMSKGAALVASGKAAGAVVPAQVVALSEGVLKAMLLAKLKIVAGVMLLTALTGFGIAQLARGALATLQGDDALLVALNQTQTAGTVWYFRFTRPVGKFSIIDETEKVLFSGQVDDKGLASITLPPKEGPSLVFVREEGKIEPTLIAALTWDPGFRSDAVKGPYGVTDLAGKKANIRTPPPGLAVPTIEGRKLVVRVNMPEPGPKSNLAKPR